MQQSQPGRDSRERQERRMSTRKVIDSPLGGVGVRLAIHDHWLREVHSCAIRSAIRAPRI
jgi:hypothetical protein